METVVTLQGGGGAGRELELACVHLLNAGSVQSAVERGWV